MIMQNYENGLTAEQAMRCVGVNSATFSTRMKKTNYIFQIGEIPNPSGTGRKIKLYKPEVLSLWKKGAELDELKRNITKKMRADKGKTRLADESEMKAIIYLTKQKYIGNAQKNLKLSCERAILDYSQNKETKVTASQLYKYLRKDGTPSFGGVKSVVYTEGWESLRLQFMKVSDTALIHDKKMNYNMPEIFENEGVAGKGFGALKVIVIDDFSRDAWSINEFGKLSMPNGIAYMDGLTGFPLWVQPCNEITTNAVATGILEVITRYGIYEDTIFVMENSKAMKNNNITQLVRCLYTEEQLERFDNSEHIWIKELFAYQKGPIIHSLPNVPTFPFKGRIERNFKLWKDEFDATRYARNYQGGNRNEAVQLTMGASPVIIGQDAENTAIGTYTPFVDEYWNEFFKWLYSDFINKSRPQRFKWWMNQTGTAKKEVTVFNLFRYYSAFNNRQNFEPNISQVAYLLYYSNPELHKRPVKVTKLGGYQVEIKGESINIMAKELNETTVGIKVVTIPIPNKKGQYVVMEVTNPNSPYFLCIGKDYTVRNIKDVNRMRVEVRTMRQERKERMRRNAIMQLENTNYTSKVLIPEGDNSITQFLEEENRIKGSFDPYLLESASPQHFPNPDLTNVGIDQPTLEESYTIIDNELELSEFDDETPDFIKALYNEYGL